MSDEKKRYKEWMANAPKKGPQAVPAATVILGRDGDAGLETLMLRRNSKLAFVGGMWVFPGGRVDPEDARDGAPLNSIDSARHAAVREAHEESGLHIDAAALVPYSHWTPPAISPKRFTTWFFVALAPAGSVEIDGGEIHDHRWIQPGEAMRRRNAGEIELAPPTWITLDHLSRFASTEALLSATRAREPELFETRIALSDDGPVALYTGDAGYESSDARAAGRRHRLLMRDEGWQYIRDDP